ncbi:hypothetical protein JTB14_019376 [Gonioctena quinquepunctata]|nr:hypothetical protein JTB14_019376 [Gonioctena quinquepunctata]
MKEKIRSPKFQFERDNTYLGSSDEILKIQNYDDINKKKEAVNATYAVNVPKDMPPIVILVKEKEILDKLQQVTGVKFIRDLMQCKEE